MRADAASLCLGRPGCILRQSARVPPKAIKDQSAGERGGRAGRESMLKAVLCDIDGTLVDSNGLHAEAWSRTFAYFGFQVTFDQALHQIGKGGDELIPVFVPEAEVERLEKPIKEYRAELFHREYFDKIKAFPGARELLLRMREEGLRVAVATSSKKEDLNGLKEKAGIGDLVEKETTSDDAEKSKPHPDIFEAVLERLGLKPEETVALGDTPWDVQAAGKAGIRTIAVMSGGWTAEELREAGAAEVYKDVEELLAKFDASVLAGGQLVA